MDKAVRHPTPWIIWILLVSVLVVLGQSLYKNYFIKDYLFYLEAPCDTSINECYVRDCGVDGDCPPNNLEVYRVFEMLASQFKNCSDNSCLNICPSSANFCEEILCSTQDDISCEGPEAATTETTQTDL